MGFTSSEYTTFAAANAIEIPWIFDRIEDRHLIIKCDQPSSKSGQKALCVLVSRALVAFPPGLVNFLMIDPVGLGESFASFHALHDYNPNLITDKVWSDRGDIRDQLGKVVQHIENVVQKYLRADYATIDEYNQEAGQIAEAFRFVVINGFPENFDSEACLALERILSSGPKCGVHVALVWDTTKELPYSIKAAQIEQNVNTLAFEKRRVRFSQKTGLRQDAYHVFDRLLDNAELSEIVKQHGLKSVDGANVVVPFDQLMDKLVEPGPSQLEELDGIWSLDNSDKLLVPLGPTGARKVQYLTFGEARTTAHHALLIGQTGSGKSNLLHVMIMSMARLYSPDQLQLYLIDFKEGVEFRDYALSQLPHARVVAIESEMEFGLSVLRGLSEEMSRRGEVMRQAGPANITDYRRETGEKMPRIVIIIDEFHGLLSEDDPSSREAASILQEISRQGRSFGIHLVLASQTLAGVQIPKAMLEQIGVRIAMQCSDDDSRQVLSDGNYVSRLLTRAGEAIYNNRGGRIEGNNIFQAALMDSEARDDHLAVINAKADEVAQATGTAKSVPFVFEGNEPAHIEMSSPHLLAAQKGPATSGPLEMWIGNPIAMRPPHAVVFREQSGAHMLVVDRDEQLGFGVIYSSVLSVLAQTDPYDLGIDFIDLSSSDQPWAEYPEAIEASFQNTCQVYGRRDMKEAFSKLARDVEDGERTRKKRLLVLFGLQRARDMRMDSGGGLIDFGGQGESGPDLQGDLKKILSDGPELGVHVLVWVDTYQNLSRSMPGASISEFGHRIVGSLSTNDSMRLLDDPAASKIEKPNRMIAYDDERVGVHTHVRPFLPPSEEWLKGYLAKLVRRSENEEN